MQRYFYTPDCPGSKADCFSIPSVFPGQRRHERFFTPGCVRYRFVVAKQKMT
jgi:hypothetical protein